jgi:hypothetical protein
MHILDRRPQKFRQSWPMLFSLVSNSRGFDLAVYLHLVRRFRMRVAAFHCAVNHHGVIPNIRFSYFEFWFLMPYTLASSGGIGVFIFGISY